MILNGGEACGQRWVGDNRSVVVVVVVVVAVIVICTGQESLREGATVTTACRYNESGVGNSEQASEGRRVRWLAA